MCHAGAVQQYRREVGAQGVRQINVNMRGANMITAQTHHRSQLTADDVASIRIASMLGVRIRHLARQTGLPKSTVWNVASGFSHAMVWSERLSIYEDAV